MKKHKHKIVIKSGKTCKKIQNNNKKKQEIIHQNLEKHHQKNVFFQEFDE